uniref:Large proline-rich protein bag6 (Trinotate prediction) n=1 Tax=Henneguya salminicola TaxID=69463 RepID=A0A6G3MEY5_HENSL
MKVSVKTLDSVTRSFDVTPETTILEFKHIISPEISIDAEKIRFIFKGTVLDDTRTVTSCELEDATIHAVERLPQVPPSQSSSEPAPNPPPEENTMFRNTLVASEELSRAVQRILRTVQTTFLDVRGPVFKYSIFPDCHRC